MTKVIGEIIYKPKQTETEAVTLVDVFKNRFFQFGLKEARNGVVFDPDKFRYDINHQWNYERGRLFGMMYKGRIVQGRGYSMKALYAFAMAIQNKEII